MILAATASAIATSGIISYAAISPTSQLFGETIAHAPEGNIALTYDDGPNAGTTERLLDILAAANVRATFFLIGKYVRLQPALARAIADAGHSIGDHTETHANLVWSSRSRVRGEIARGKQSIEDAIGRQVSLFRPPWGARRPDVLKIVREFGLTPVMWNVTSYDWRPITAEQELAHIHRQMKRNATRDRGSLILMHDGSHLSLGADRAHTLEATRKLIARSRDTKFVTIGD